MAAIYIYNKTAYSVSLRLTDLDTNWAKGTRTVTWELGMSGEGYYSEMEQGEDLSNGVSEGGDATFTGLSPGTSYDILCKVYYESNDGIELLASITDYFTTDYEEETSWKLSIESAGQISSSFSDVVYINEYEIWRYSVYFSKSGTAVFYTTGSKDTIGYLSVTADLDSSTGKPTDYLVHNDDGGNVANFKMSYNVKPGIRYYVWVRYVNAGNYGTTYLHIEPPEATTRPYNFSWTYDKVQYGEFNLTADEWNDFTSRINEFRNYWNETNGTNLPAYSFTTAYQNDNVTADMYNQARIAIQDMSGYGTYIPTVSTGQEITAYMMNILVSELNAIP